MCGKESHLFRTSIEGTEMNVCSDCGKYGKILNKVRKAPAVEKTKPKIAEHTEPPIEIIKMIVNNYPEVIRKKREKLGMKQKEFAKMLSMKESIVHKLETGNFEPSMNMAARLERALNITLIEEHKEEHKNLKSESSEGFTLGDIANIRKR